MLRGQSLTLDGAPDHGLGKPLQAFAQGDDRGNDIERLEPKMAEIQRRFQAALSHSIGGPINNNVVILLERAAHYEGRSHEPYRPWGLPALGKLKPKERAGASPVADIPQAEKGTYAGNLTPEKVAEGVKKIGVGFMFAPNHHSAMKHAAPARRELGVRTLFNLLGPLTNPAGAPNQVMGVFNRELTLILARVLQALGSRHVLVVHAEEGLDEISLASPTFVAELKDGHVSEYELEPGLFDLPQVAARLALATVERESPDGRIRWTPWQLAQLATDLEPALAARP